MKIDVKRSRSFAPGAWRRVVWAWAVVAVGAAVVADSAQAVIISAGNGSGNTSAPADDPGWANVGARGSGSAIYLGNRWVLTANHVGAGSTVFQGVAYGAVPDSQIQLVNPAGIGFNAPTDLLLYRIDGSPPLPSLTIDTVVPGVGSDVVLIGRGRDRSPNASYWTSTWVSSPTPSTYTGFGWGTSNTMRWGTNTIDFINELQSISNTSERAFAMDFDAAGTPYEAQGASGDSGGAVFYKNPSTGKWDLAGLMFAINVFGGQPSGTAVYGNVTYAADLAIYRDQIYSHVGLPGDLNLDGQVDVFDMNIISAQWQTAGSMGDANHDGIVNLFDLMLVSANWTRGSPPADVAASLASSAGVPEPTSAMLIVVGGAFLCLGGRRRIQSLLRRRRALLAR
jgi:Trypsin